MTLSNDFKKTISVIAWGVCVLAYLAIFLWFTGLIDPVWFISPTFLDNNNKFLSILVMCLIGGSFLILITPEKYRELGHKMLAVVALLMTIMNSFIVFKVWDNTDSLSFNLHWLAFAIPSLLAEMSLTLLVFAFIENRFKSNIKKPILTKKKVLIALAIIAGVSLLITFACSFDGLPHQWII